MAKGTAKSLACDISWIVIVISDGFQVNFWHGGMVGTEVICVLATDHLGAYFLFSFIQQSMGARILVINLCTEFLFNPFAFLLSKGAYLALLEQLWPE